MTASLATVEESSGRPHASFITVAAEAAGAPLFLISKLAKHTNNLAADARASILFLGPETPGDPLARSRLSVFGEARVTHDETAARRFLARHRDAEAYAQFADFTFYRLVAEAAQLIGGFGRIHELNPEDLLFDTSKAAALIEAEGDIVDHMNHDHADTIQLCAVRLLGGDEGPWRMSGCDPEGCDLVAGDRALRLAFPTPVLTPQEIRQTLVALVAAARAKGP